MFRFLFSSATDRGVLSARLDRIVLLLDYFSWAADKRSDEGSSPDDLFRTTAAIITNISHG